MKKILLLSSLLVCLVICFSACTKRDKLTDNTMILQIEPTDSETNFNNLIVGEQYALRAIVRNRKYEEIDESVSWSISPSDKGSFSKKNSKNTVFTAESSGKGRITLSCQGIYAFVDVTIS